MTRIPILFARLRFGAWVWVAPLLAALGVVAGHNHLTKIDLGLVAAALVLAVYLRPRWFLMAVPVVYPFQLFVLAFAYKAGVSASVTRDLGYWIELVAVGLALRAIRSHARRPLDGLDWAGLLYVAVVSMYRLAPTLFVHGGPNGPPTAGTVLNTALRNDVFFVVMFLVARHLGLTERDRRRFALTTFAVGVVVSLFGAYEYLASASWNHFVVDTLGVTKYQTGVLKTIVPNPADVRVYTLTAGHKLLRIGSVFIDQLECAFFLVAALAVGCEYLSRAERRRWLIACGSLAITLALVLTQTRDGILAAAVVILFVIRPLKGRDPLRRVQFTLLAGLTAILLLPVAVAVGLGTRTTAAINGSDQSATVHVSAITKGARAFADEPLGRGLGTGGTNGTRFGITSTLTSEDQYLQIGNETGLFSLLPFLALTGLIIRRLWRAARTGSMPAAAWSGAFTGLALAGLFLQVWLSLITAVIVWTAIGMSLAPTDRRDPERAPELRAGEPDPGVPIARVGG